MTPLRLILSAGVCSIALSGCIPVAASLALQAVSMVSGGGGKEGKGFRNPMDKQTSERQVREALSRLNDRVDPACQAQLDAMEKKTDKPDATAAGATPKDAGAPVTSAKPQEAVPVNLLAKVGPEQGQADAARTADSTPGAASERATGEAVPAQPAAEAAKGDDEAKPVKAALAPSGTAAPGQCEHRLVCLPGTPKPTLMLMCPGKGDPKAAAKTVAAGDAPAATADAQASNASTADAPTADAKTGESPAAPSVIPAVATATPSDPTPVVTPAAAVSVTPPAVPAVVPPPIADTAPAAAAPIEAPAAPAPAKVMPGAVPKLTIPPIAAPAPVAVATPPVANGAPVPAPGAVAGVPKITAPVVSPAPPSATPMPTVAGAAPTVAIPDIMPTIASPLAQPPALDASTASAETAARPADAASAPVAAGAPKAVPAPKASAPSGPDRSIESGGVADWNWAYDPAKQL